jgi:hypothetical protein
MPQVESLSILYTYPNLEWKILRINAQEGVTVGHVLSGAEKLVVDVEGDGSNDPYRSMEGRRREANCPCQRQETYFDHLRKQYGEAGLSKVASSDELWEFRFGPQVSPWIIHKDGLLTCYI